MLNKARLIKLLQMVNSNKDLENHVKLVETLVNNGDIREALIETNACREMNPTKQDLENIEKIEIDLAVEQHAKKDAD